jgi:hypothetical protein
MLAPSSDLLRVGLRLKLNQVKRATRSYLRDRTDQATGIATSYAVAAGLFAVAGIFLVAGGGRVDWIYRRTRNRAFLGSWAFHIALQRPACNTSQRRNLGMK